MSVTKQVLERYLSLKDTMLILGTFIHQRDHRHRYLLPKYCSLYFSRSLNLSQPFFILEISAENFDWLWIKLDLWRNIIGLKSAQRHTREGEEDTNSTNWQKSSYTHSAEYPVEAGLSERERGRKREGKDINWVGVDERMRGGWMKRPNERK